MKTIPLHSLRDSQTTGLEVVYFSPDQPLGHRIDWPLHRDDNYLFLLIKQGSGSMMIDFSPVYLSRYDAYFVLPAQVHYQIQANESEGWLILADPAILEPEVHDLFLSGYGHQQPQPLSEVCFQQCEAILGALYQEFRGEEGRFHGPIMHHLLNAFLGKLANQYATLAPMNEREKSASKITQAFRLLVAEWVKTQKSPAAYAQLLNISPAYLTEAVRLTTGSHATYWIQAEIMLQAKRLLVHTDLTVKQIAHQLGYQDHTYFSRLFKQVNATTPQSFRKIYRLQADGSVSTQ